MRAKIVICHVFNLLQQLADSILIPKGERQQQVDLAYLAFLNKIFIPSVIN